MILLDFFIYIILRPRYGPGVDFACNTNKYLEYFLKGGRCVGLANLATSCSDFLEIWEPQRPGNLRACPGLYRNCFNLTPTVTARSTDILQHAGTDSVWHMQKKKGFLVKTVPKTLRLAKFSSCQRRKLRQTTQYQ